MPDWTTLRSAAQNWHSRLRHLLPPDAPLLPDADTLLSAAQLDTGVDAFPMPPDDPLLAGAKAVLDRSVPCIWYAHDPARPQQLARFALAHEFAHLQLHPDLSTDRCIANDSPADYVVSEPGIAAGQVAEGYGPAERREREANLFAAELLLPGPTLRHLFIEEGWTASRFAEHVGVTEACVLAQLTESLLQNPQHNVEEHVPVQHRAGPPLDPSQREAAMADVGPLLVDAGPGTGKTRTLIARLVWLLETQQVAADNILALTFSNQAADEMRVRLRAAVGSIAERVWIGTFHSFGYELLRKDGGRIGLPDSPTLLDPSDAVTLLERNLDRLALDEYQYLFRPALPFPDILSCISSAKDELCGPADYLRLARTDEATAGDDPKAQRAARRSLEIAGIYAVYERLLRDEGLLDFGDLILRAVELLDACPDVRARWQAQFPHILADEYQDVNRASAQLLRRLAGDGHGFWAVGDVRQAIYRFRGASPANVRDFEQDFPAGRRRRLQHNYRSCPQIVALASRFAGSMPDANPSEEPWNAVRPDHSGPALHVAEAEDEAALVDGLARQIEAERLAGTPLQAQAILCRTNRQAADLASALEDRGIPSLNLGGFFERDEVRDLLSIVSLVGKPDGVALVRVGRIYGVPTEDVLALLRAARDAGQPFPVALDLAATLDSISEPGRIGLTRLAAQLAPNLFRGDTWYLLCRYLFEMGDYLRPMLADQSAAGVQRRTAIAQLLQVVQRLSRRLPPESHESVHSVLLDNLRHRLICGQDRLAPRTPALESTKAVRLMTVHQSKGLEFPVVYLPNLSVGMFPPRQGAQMAVPPAALSAPGSGDLRAQEEESEACLFFVAISRARDRLYLCRAASRNGRPLAACSLLESIEPALTALSAQRLTWATEPKHEDTALGPASLDLPGMTDVTSGATLASPALQRGGSEPFGTCPGTASGVREDARPGAPSGGIDSAGPVQPTPQRVESSSDHRMTPFTASALEQYQQCPRRFYYKHILRLQEPDSDGAYLVFHRCVSQMQEWIVAERLTGRPPDQASIAQRFNELWDSETDVDSAYARVLRAHGVDLLNGLHTKIGEAGRHRVKRELVAHLDAGKVRVTADDAEALPDGTLQLINVRTGKPGADDHTEPRLALLRHAAKQHEATRPVQIAIDYLATSERKEVKETPRWEPARVQKYNIALEAVNAGRFDADPDPRKCALCSFYLICPV